MATAGAQNLAQWRSRARTRANEIQAQVDTFRAGLLRDVGVNPSASKVGLIEAAVLTYGCILKLRHGVINSSKAGVVDLAEKSSWSCANLARLLRLLNLDAKPRPRCLADLVEPKRQI